MRMYLGKARNLKVQNQEKKDLLITGLKLVAYTSFLISFSALLAYACVGWMTG